jgi:phosphonate transport system substrate-binding protein
MVLIAPTVERNRQEQLRKIMSASPSSLIKETGYVPNQPVPDYQYMISVVKRVRSIATHLYEKPARLF